MIRQTISLVDYHSELFSKPNMVNPDLTNTLAFYGCLLGAKMGLMTLLTARQRLVKKVMYEKHDTGVTVTTNLNILQPIHACPII